MKFNIDREKLNRGLMIVSKVISTRPSLPILSNVLITTDNNGLKISGTDLDLGISFWLPAVVETEGSFTLPARIFSEFVSNNTDSSIDINLADSVKIEIKSNKFRASISGIAADDFPIIPEVSGNIEITLDLATLVKSFRQTVITCALDDIRPALSGVYIKFANNKLTVAATDSFRLGEKLIDLNQDVPVREMIIPARTVQEVIRISGLLTEESKVKLIIGESQVKIKIGSAEIISRLVEATFPAYEKIIPQESMMDISATSTEFQTALRASRIFAATGSNNIRLEVKDQVASVSSLTTERGEARTNLETEIIYHGEDKEVVIAYNAKYLADAITACESDRVILFIAGPKKPTIVRNPDDPHYQHLVMPVDIKE